MDQGEEGGGKGGRGGGVGKAGVEGKQFVFISQYTPACRCYAEVMHSTEALAKALHKLEYDMTSAFSHSVTDEDAPIAHQGGLGAGGGGGWGGHYLLALPSALPVHLHLLHPLQQSLILSVHIPADHAAAAVALTCSSSSTLLCNGMLAAASQLPAAMSQRSTLYEHTLCNSAV